MADLYDFTVTSITGEDYSLERYRGHPLLIVNTASKCGFTPQFEGLEKLYTDYHDQGLIILGFPCNQFMAQDPGSDEKINAFCQLNYGVNFPMHSKIAVRGKHQAPLYHYLIEHSTGKPIKWNFTKFLIDQDGKIIRRFEPKETPASIEPVLQELL